MKVIIVTILGMATLGYLSGSIGQQLTAPDSSPSKQESNTKLSSRNRGTPDSIPSKIKSNDSIASLADVPAPELYDRLALWLLDASPSEMQEFWTTYTARTDRSNDLNDLVFINWTRIDPEAAITAAEGTEFAKYPWWAWACHEPQKALSEVLSRYQGQENQEPIGNVMWGLGEFHPAWLREHLDELPEKWMRDRALSGYVKFADTENPRESIEFLKKYGWGIDPKTLAALGREDPLTAYQIALDLKNNDNNYRYQGLSDQLINSLAASDPALLDQILAHTTSPQEKMKLQLKQFESLLKLDPTAAEAKAKNLPPGWAREDHLAALAQHHLKDNPDKAIEIAVLLLKENNNSNYRFTMIHYENGSSGSSGCWSGEAPTTTLVSKLSTSHAEALINQVVAEKVGYQSVARAWATRDLPAFAAWVNQQDDPEVYQATASIVASNLTNKKHDSEAMDWAQSVNKDASGSLPSVTRHIYSEWFQSNPEEARAWKDTATLDDDALQLLNTIEQANQ